MADRFSKSAALLGLLAPFVQAAPVDQAAAPGVCSAAVTTVASALRAEPTADALCAKLLNLDDRITTTTVIPDAGFTSTTVIPVVTNTLTVTAPTSVVTVTATVETCAQNQKRAAATGIRNALKSKVKSIKGKKATKLPKISTKKRGKVIKTAKNKVKTAKNNVKTKVKSVKGTKKLLPTSSAGQKKKVVSKLAGKGKPVASKAVSKVKGVKGTTVTFAAGAGIAKSTKISAGIPGVVTASAQVGITQTITVSGRAIVTVITPSLLPTSASFVSGVRTILPSAINTPAPDFSRLSCAIAPADLQAQPCDVISKACGCASLPAAGSITVTTYPASVPTVTRYNSISIVYTSVPILYTTQTITATGCPSAIKTPAPVAGSPNASAPAQSGSAQPSGGNDNDEDEDEDEGSDPNTNQNNAGPSAPSVTAAPTACNNQGVDWAVYTVATGVFGNQKRALPISIDGGLAGSGAGAANGGVSIFTDSIKSTASSAVAGAASSAVAVVTTVSGKVVTVTSYVAAQATSGVGAVSSLGGFLTSAVGAVQSSAAAGVSSIRNDVNGGISTAVAGASSIRNDVNGGISTAVSDASALKASATSIVGDVRSSAGAFGSSVVAGAGSAASTLVSDAGAALASATSIVSDVRGSASALVSGAQASASAIRGSVTSIVGGVQSVATSLRGDATSIVVGAQGTISSVYAAATSLRGEIPAQISSARAAVQTTIINGRSDILNNLVAARSGISGATPDAKDTALTAPSVIDALKTSGTALVQRAYLLAPQTGTYTFLLKSALDQALLWTGDAATKAFSDGNVVCAANAQTQGSCSYTVDLQKGQYLPYKVLLEHGTGQLNDFALTISGPGGDVVQNNVNVMPQNIVRFGCGEDALLAPVLARL